MRAFDQSVCFDVIAFALGARQDRCVVGQHGAERRLIAELSAIDVANARDDAIGRRIGDQVFLCASAGLRGNDQCAIFDKGVFVAQIGDIFTGGPLASGMPLCDRVWTGVIIQNRVTIKYGLQIRANLVQVHGLYVGIKIDVALLSLDHHQDFVFGYLISLNGADVHDAAIVLGDDGILHFHRFDDSDGLAFLHHVIHAYRQLDNTTAQRRAAGD